MDTKESNESTESKKPNQEQIILEIRNILSEVLVAAKNKSSLLVVTNNFITQVTDNKKIMTKKNVAKYNPKAYASGTNRVDNLDQFVDFREIKNSSIKSGTAKRNFRDMMGTKAGTNKRTKLSFEDKQSPRTIRPNVNMKLMFLKEFQDLEKNLEGYKSEVEEFFDNSKFTLSNDEKIRLLLNRFKKNKNSLNRQIKKLVSTFKLLPDNDKVSRVVKNKINFLKQFNKTYNLFYKFNI